MQILVTGGSGALGPLLLAELLRQDRHERIGVLLRPAARRRQSVEQRFAGLLAEVSARLDSPSLRDAAATRIVPLTGDATQPQLGLSSDAVQSLRRETAVAIHAAADTRLQSDERQLRLANVVATRQVVELARTLPKLRQFVQVSTHCVAGKRVGVVREEFSAEPPEFVNGYEQTKWEAEQIVHRAPFPVQIVRLTNCVADERTGRVHRPGGIHYVLDWMLRGLVPMIPGAPHTPVDLISNDLAVGVIAKAALSSREGVNIYQVAAGTKAPRLDELLKFLVACFQAWHEGWRRGQIASPAIVDAATFQAFRDAVARSRDLLFGQILAAVDALLPVLLYPRTYETTRAEALWGRPLPLRDWRELVAKVVRHRYDPARPPPPD